MTDMSNILSMSIGDTPTMKLLTPGIYDFVVKRYFDKEYVNAEGNKGQIVTFVVGAANVVESDLEEDDLELAEDVYVDFFTSPKSLAMRSPTISVRAFAQHVLDLSDDELGNLDYATAFETMIGQRFRAKTKDTMRGKNKDIPAVQIDRVLND